MAGASSIAAGAIVPMEGLFFDELSKIRVLDSEKQQETAELRNECKAFVDSAYLTAPRPACDAPPDLRGACRRPAWCAAGRHVGAEGGTSVRLKTMERQTLLSTIRHIAHDHPNPPIYPNQPTTTTHTLAAADIGKFQETVGSLIGTVLELSQAVETQKLKAIGARNLKQSLEQDRHAEKMQLEAQIGEKQAHLERLRIEHQALTKVQFEQEQVGSSLRRFAGLGVDSVPIAASARGMRCRWRGPMAMPGHTAPLTRDRSPLVGSLPRAVPRAAHRTPRHANIAQPAGERPGGTSKLCSLSMRAIV